MICGIIQIYKMNCSYDLRNSKVLGSNMFIFMQRNNIVKNHQLMPAFLFLFLKRPLAKTTTTTTTISTTTGKISVKQMPMNQFPSWRSRGPQGVMYDVCYILIAIMC